MDPFYNPQQQQYPTTAQQPQHGPGQQHFPNNNASHNYFMQHQPHFLHQNANLLPGGNADQQRLQDGQQQQQQTSSFSEGNFQGNQAPYRSLYQPPQPGTTNQDNQ